MMLELLICFSFLSIIISVCLGYGRITNEILLKNISSYSIGEIGLYGLFFLSFISVFLNFFISLNYIITFIICSVGIVLFFFYYNYKILNIYNILILIFILPTIVYFEYHADYFWYHLPYVNIKSEFKIIFGLTNLNDNLGYSHIWYDILSLFNLPFYKTYYLSIVSSAFIFFILVFIKDLYFISKIKITKFFLLLFLCFIFLTYSDPKDFGSEIQGNLLYILICVYMLIFFEEKNLKNKESLILKIILLFFFAILIRSNSILFAPLIFIFLVKNIRFFLNTILINKSFYFFIFTFFSIYLIKNIITSGCLSYPIYFTCFDNFDWSIGIEHAKLKYYHLSAQSKGYLLWLKNENLIENIFDFYKYRENSNFVSPEMYLKNFDWFKYWWLYEHDVDRLFNIIYFFILLTILVLIFNFYKISIKNSLIGIKSNILKILFFFVPCISIFYFLPQSRYGGYGVLFVFSCIIFLSLVIKIKNFNIIPIFVFLLVSSVYFQIKNYDRLFEKYLLIKKNSIENFYNYPEEELVKIENFKNKFNFPISIRNFGNNDILGKPLYCFDTKGLCTSIIRISCIKTITIKKNYIFIKPKAKKCSDIIDKYLWY